MDITTHNRIELTLNLEEHLYSLKMPNGVPIEEAEKACGFFLAALSQMKSDKEPEPDSGSDKEIEEIIEEIV